MVLLFAFLMGPWNTQVEVRRCDNWEHTSGGEKIMTAGNVKGFRDGEKVLDGFILGSLGDGQ